MPRTFALATVLTLLPCLAPGSPAHASEKRHNGMVVVAPASFHQALETYVAERAKRRPTELVALETILKESKGVDDPERLKRWLYRAWKERSVGYVLLVGDADVMPVRYMVLDRVTPAAFDYAFYPSDLYYADVARRDGSFDDWNGRKQGFHASYFGEVRGEKNKKDPINYDRIDYRPELAVGRWPVSTADQVRVVAEKSRKYEQNVRAGKAPGLRRAAFVGVEGWTDFVGLMNGWASHLPPGWKPVQLYGGSGTSSASSEANVVRVLNEGASVVFHAGHGYDEGWAHSLGAGAIAHLENADRLPVMLSAGCSTARFATLPPYEPYQDVDGKEHKGSDHGEVFHAPPPPPSPYPKGKYNHNGLGKRLVRGPNGAVAYIGCNTGGQPCGLTLLAGFARALVETPNPTIGDCWASAVAHYYEAEHLATIKPTPDWYPASIFFQGMKYMLYGDPALPLPGPLRAARAGE